MNYKVLFVILILCNISLSETWIQSGIHTEQGPGYLGQINDHTCGPHSLMQSIYKITKIDMKEKTLAEWAGTTSSGTSHEGIEKALRTFNTEHKKNLTITWYNFNSVSISQIGKWMNSPRSAVFFHLLYRNTWGHYELPYKIINGDNYLVVANSLGSKKEEGFYGYLETRSWSSEKEYISGISQKSVCHISY